MACKCGSKKRANTRPTVAAGLRSVGNRPIVSPRQRSAVRGVMRALPKKTMLKSPSGMNKERRMAEQKRREAILRQKLGK